MSTKKSKTETKLLIDMDGVLVDTLPAWLRWNYATTGIMAELSDITKWTMHECPVYANVAFKSVLRTPLENPVFWRTLPPMEGALDFMHEVIRRGIPYNIVTAPANDISTSAKYEWVERQLPEALKHLVITNDKASIRGNVLIDDRDKNVVDFFMGNPEAELAFVPVNAYLNKDMLDEFGVVFTPRVPNWDLILRSL